MNSANWSQGALRFSGINTRLWFYHSYGRHNEASGSRSLKSWVSDRDYSVREAIANAHQDRTRQRAQALAGQVLEAEGVTGFFTAEEAAAGRSTDSRYPLNGMYVASNSAIREFAHAGRCPRRMNAFRLTECRTGT